MKSTQYKCPKCSKPVDIEANFEADEEYGDSISVIVHCNHCADTRVDTIDECTYDFQNLVNKIGT